MTPEERLAALEDLLASVELDGSSYDAESDSCTVIGNVDMATLRALKLAGAEDFKPKPKPRKQKFYAFEVATDGAYHLGAYISEARMGDALATTLADLDRWQEKVETQAIGEVWAETWEQALDKIRAGQWEYSQKL